MRFTLKWRLWTLMLLVAGVGLSLPTAIRLYRYYIGDGMKTMTITSHLGELNPAAFKNVTKSAKGWTVRYDPNNPRDMAALRTIENKFKGKGVSYLLE